VTRTRRWAVLKPVPAENFVLLAIIDVVADDGYASRTITSVVFSLLLSLRSCLRSRAALQLEVLALRHQLQVLNRSRPPRLRLTPADRLLWTWLARIWREWRAVLVIVKPATVIAWHHRGFRTFWSWKSRRRPGRPPVAPDVRALIRTMSEANPGWGAPRIHGELLKLGISLSQATVAKYIVRSRRPRFAERPTVRGTIRRRGSPAINQMISCRSADWCVSGMDTGNSRVSCVLPSLAVTELILELPMGPA
jgi:hypothetical protein